MVDLPTASVIMASTEFWSTDIAHLIDEPRLRGMLRVRAFYRPAVRSDSGRQGVPSFIFPRYLVCSRCDRLAPFTQFHFDGRSFRCGRTHKGKTPKRGPLAFPARFVVACSAGHLDDFPWFEYVHQGARCKGELEFWGSGSSGSVGDLHVRCRACKRDRPMSDAYGTKSKEALGPCKGHRPWLGEGNAEPCAMRLRTLLRGASNLYFPIVQSALSIPEWDDPIQLALAHHESALEKISGPKDIEVGIEMGFLPGLSGYTPEAVWEALEARRAQAEKPPTPLDIRRDEFLALRAEPNLAEATRREFEIEPVAVPEGFEGKLARLVVVRRLKEVRALDGFSRIDSAFDIAFDEEQPETFMKQTLSADEPYWRPAVELRGEGIFVELEEDALRPWEENPAVTALASRLDAAHAAWRRERDLAPASFPGSRYILLHSLAHLLINALALDCGYSSTSIRERIYSSADPATRMAGILLYTATPDSDGSLGGLADQGKPQRFGTLLRDALDRAHYCSSDPLCGHHAAAELGRLNGAACHACLLVAETSCERANRYLDRAHVVETVGHFGASYFGS